MDLKWLLSRIFDVTGFLKPSRVTLTESSLVSLTDSNALFEPLDASVQNLLPALKAGQIKSVDLVKGYLSRIYDMNPKVNAVICVNPDALEIAAECDRIVAEGKDTGALHGIPILLKDLFWTEDKMDTTAGSYALKGARLGYESTVVTKLREAGAIILGKTNLAEFANFRGTGSWSAIGGECTGVYYKRQDPASSSCGNAVAIRLGFAAAAIGTETNSSITCPAEKSNIVGLKPTPGLTSRVGIIQTNEFQDTPGPMTRTAWDAAYILNVIAGPDQNDFLREKFPKIPLPDYTQACQADALKGVRIAVPRLSLTQGEMDKHIIAKFNQALRVLEECGAEVLDDLEFARWTVTWSRANLALNWTLLNRNTIKTFTSLTKNPNGIASTQDLIHFLETEPTELFEKYGAGSFEKAAASAMTEAEIVQAAEMRLDMGGDLAALLAQYNCDAVVVPTACRNPSDLGQCPTITTPMGFYPADAELTESRGRIVTGPHVPMGLLFIAPKFHEREILGYAHAFEQVMGPRLKVDDILQQKT